MSSFLDKRIVDQGMFSPTKRYAFTNITDKPFTFKWAKKDITVAPKETKDMPEYLAVLATRKIVDQIMLGIEYDKTTKIREKSPEYLAPNIAGSLGVPALRKQWEEAVLKELPAQESMESSLGILKMKEEIQKDIENSAKPADPIESVTVSKGEFSELITAQPVNLSV